ncbi:MAG: hypothetical protein IJB41_05750, partial [Clostridia bacterium]|nr:hypothetical protein [Clostridia bacterium]
MSRFRPKAAFFTMQKRAFSGHFQPFKRPLAHAPSRFPAKKFAHFAPIGQTNGIRPLLGQVPHALPFCTAGEAAAAPRPFYPVSCKARASGPFDRVLSKLYHRTRFPSPLAKPAASARIKKRPAARMHGRA